MPPRSSGVSFIKLDSCSREVIRLRSCHLQSFQSSFGILDQILCPGEIKRFVFCLASTCWFIRRSGAELEAGGELIQSKPMEYRSVSRHLHRMNEAEAKKKTYCLHNRRQAPAVLRSDYLPYDRTVVCQIDACRDFVLRPVIT